MGNHFYSLDNIKREEKMWWRGIHLSIVWSLAQQSLGDRHNHTLAGFQSIRGHGHACTRPRTHTHTHTSTALPVYISWRSQR